MDRRPAGVLLLIAALLSSVAVPMIAGRSVGGAAVAESVASPPAVGSCVTAVTPEAFQPGPMDSETADEGYAVPLPVPTVKPCHGAVMGEIISVTAANRPEVGTLGEYDDGHPICRSQVDDYLGINATTNLLGVAWSNSIYLNAVMVGPDARARAAGRTWGACVLAAVGQTYPAPPTLKGSWGTSRLPAAFGLCWADVVNRDRLPIPCTAAHRVQQFAAGLVLSPSASATSIVSAADPVSVANGCRQLASRVMQTPDPTVGGELQIQVVSYPPGPWVLCTAIPTGGRRLTGSLIGLGQKRLALS